ncbi:autotransporter outer membrane beta-barrel domain-containing protein [Buttiauxella gaviniae]|uniref:Autotransporter outer membrane beta-barrel domain-containing protein n=1 Tax=Buttiauxella gaviniae TaxID=82990 RepID=A0ABV3NZU0_9ENTR
MDKYKKTSSALRVHRARLPIIPFSLSLLTLSISTIVNPAFAGGDGGNGGFNSSEYGFAGDAGDSTTGVGGNGGVGFKHGGGYNNGGGAGRVISTATTITTSVTGGAGGTGSDGDGTRGANGGGGGGTGVVAKGAIINKSVITGGAGGMGGTGRGGRTGSGGGGAGVVTNSSVTNSGTITGGSSTTTWNGGGGGGGAGIYVSGNTAQVSIINTGTINGGNGGNNLATPQGGRGGNGEGGAAGASRSAYSDGGMAIRGGNLLIQNAGVINAGAGGDGAQNYAIYFNGGTNQLLLSTGSVISGTVYGGGSDTLLLQNALATAGSDTTGGGSLDGSQYIGIEHLILNSGTWTLSNTLSLSDAILNNGLLLLTTGTSLGASVVKAQGGGLGAASDGITINKNITLLVNPDASGGNGLTLGGTHDFILSGVLSGAGDLNQTGSHKTTLTGINTYTGQTTVNGGSLNLSGNGSIANTRLLNIKSGSVDISAVNTGASLARLSGDSTGTLALGSKTLTLTNAQDTFAGNITGSGNLTIDEGSETFSGNSSTFSGTTTANDSASAIVTGTLGSSASQVNINSGGRLAGTGTVGGSVDIADNGILNPGLETATSPVGTLTIKKDLSLSDLSQLNYQFGSAYTPGGQNNDLTNVNGDLTLDGELNVTVTPGQKFNYGVYRIFNYDGTLNDNTLAIAKLPVGFDADDFYIQTNIKGQVNLINSTGITLRFWDGDNGTPNDSAIQGGDGTWRDSVTDPWTIETGKLNSSWSDKNFAVFMGTGGTVTVDNTDGDINTSGMQFYVDGYTLEDGTLTLTPVDGDTDSIIRVGDGSEPSSGYIATINSILTGASGLSKEGYGKLILGGVNTYTGDTTIESGVLSVAQSNNLGDASGKVILDGGTLETRTTLNLNRDISLTDEGGALQTDTDTTLTDDRGISGTGDLTKLGDGTLRLTGKNSYTGATNIKGGTLSLSQEGSLTASKQVDLENGTLDISTANQPVSLKAMSGDSTSNVTLGGQTLKLTNDKTGSTFAGVISGSGDIELNGVNETLSGVNTYSGNTTVTDGSLLLSGDGSLADSQLLTLTNSQFDVTGINTATSISALAGDSTAEVLLGSKALTLTDAQGDFGGIFTGDDSSNLTITSGAQTLSGTSDHFEGDVTVENNAQLYINGSFGSALSLIETQAKGVLGGSGTVGGDVIIDDDATLSPGSAAGKLGTLNIAGALQLNQNSVLNYQFGEANVAGGALNSLTSVGGDLMLDGQLNVSASPGGKFLPGVYRLFNYQGELTDNTLEVNSLPAGVNPADIYVQTAVKNQVNLINSTTRNPLNFWEGTDSVANDGVISGGDGTWRASPTSDWTNQYGAPNANWAQQGFAVFSAAPGKVSVDNVDGAINTDGMQFVVDGYQLEDGELTLQKNSQADGAIIRVGDGTTAGAVITATIASKLTGNTALVKEDAGTLILSGNNDYTGGTYINGGTLSVAGDGNLGESTGAVNLNNGTLRVTDNMVTPRAVVLNSLNDAIEVDADKTLTLQQGLSGAGSLTKQGAGELQLEQANTYAGSTLIAQGVLSTQNAGILNASSPLTIAQNAGLNLAGNTQQTGTLTNGGTLNFGSQPGTQLVVNGDYQGNNGQLVMNAALAGDDSLTDQLKVSGNTSGNTQLIVTNRAGLGAQTVNGVKVVEVGGRSDGIFTLKSDYQFRGQGAVIVGPYSYQLYKNGVSTPQDGDWYLRSQVTSPVPPAPPASVDTTDSTGSYGAPPAPTGSDVSSSSQAFRPIWQPGVPLYESYPSVLAQFNHLSTLKQRVGGRNWSSSDTLENGVELGSWGRMVGNKTKETATSSATDSTLRTNSVMWQVGVDGVVHENASGTLVAGVNARYGNVNADIKSLFGNGSIDSTGYGPGATLTWYGNNGWYVDNQAQFNWYSSSLYSDTLKRSMTENNHAYGYALSSETGKHILLSDNWTLTPQAQVVYSWVNFQDFTDPYGTHVTDDSNGSTLVRVGVSPEYQRAWSKANETSHLRVYGIANLEKAYSAATQIEVSNLPMTRRTQTLWQSLGGGGEVQLANGKYQFYGEVSAKTALENTPEKNYALNATAGFKMNF